MCVCKCHFFVLVVISSNGTKSSESEITDKATRASPNRCCRFFFHCFYDKDAKLLVWATYNMAPTTINATSMTLTHNFCKQNVFEGLFLGVHFTTKNTLTKGKRTTTAKIEKIMAPVQASFK